ncbi:MAG: EAL domain-containing protein [Burkholderiales bacterium]
MNVLTGNWEAAARAVKRHGNLTALGFADMGASGRAAARKSVAAEGLCADNGEIKFGRLSFQSRVDMLDGRVAGAEVLIEWKRPEGTAAGARSRAMSASEWAVREVCKQAAVLERDNRTALRTHVRLTARQLMNPRLLEYFSEAIAESGIRSESIECGVAESLLLGSPQLTVGKMRQLTDAGIGVAICDFGSDRSGLAYPSAFPVHSLWLGPAFFARFTRGHAASAALRAVLRLAAKRGLKVAACGVSGPEQMMWLYNEGCELMQGDFLCRPLPLETFKTFLAELKG